MIDTNWTEISVDNISLDVNVNTVTNGEILLLGDIL